MNYKTEMHRQYGNTGITYGIVEGDSHIVFFKVGRGGDIYGRNKAFPGLYFRLSNLIHEAYGCTVIVSDNPLNEKNPNPLIYDMDFVREYAEDRGWADYTIDYIGNSAGANYGAWYGCQFPKIQHMLMINPIVNMNTHRLKNCCADFGGADMTFIFGDQDPSFRYVSVIPTGSNIHLKLLPGQGHNLQGDVFVSVVMDYLKKQD